MSLGLVGASGAEALRQSIRQRLIDQAAQQRQDQEMSLAERRMALQEQETGLRHSEFDQQREDRKLAMEDRAAQQSALQHDRELTQARELHDTIPAGRIAETPENKNIVGMLRMIGAGKDDAGRPAVDEGPLLPGDNGAAQEPAFIKAASFRQVNTQADNERQTKAEQDRRAHELKMEEIASGKAAAAANKPPSEAGWSVQQGQVNGAPGWVRINSHTGEIKPIAAGELAPKPTSQETNRKSMAQSVQSRMDELQGQIDEADHMGLLGPAAGRVSEFLSGKVGSTGDPVKDDLLGQLRMNLSAARSGFASLHGRGGANSGIAKELESRMDQGHMSRAELSGALKAMRSWVDDYAGGAKPTSTKPTAEDLIKKYGG